MPTASFLQFLVSDPANIPTAPSGAVRLFSDSTNSNAPSYKDDAGVVHSLVDAVSSVFGRTGAVVAVSGDYAIANITGLVAALAAKQASDAELTAIAGLTSAANKLILFTGSGTAVLLDFSTSSALGSSDTTIPSQKAIKDYIDSLVTGGATDVMIFKGVIDCSANPNYPAADAGNVYKVSVAGKIGGASGPNVEAGDTLYCITDSTASGTQAGVGANWVIAQVNLDGAVIGPTSVTDSRIALFDGTTGKLLKDGAKLLTDLIANTLLTTLGDIIYASAANTPARLAGNTTATKKFLRSTGAAGVATAPAYDVVTPADVAPSMTDDGNLGASKTIDWSDNVPHKGALTANCTLTFSNGVAGGVYVFRVTQGSGPYAITWPAGVHWSGGTAPTLTATNAKVDIFTFLYDGTTYFGVTSGLNYTA